MGGIPCCIAEMDVLLASVMLVRERANADAAPSESIEVAGDTPLDMKDRRRRFCNSLVSVCAMRRN